MMSTMISAMPDFFLVSLRFSNVSGCLMNTVQKRRGWFPPG